MHTCAERRFKEDVQGQDNVNAIKALPWPKKHQDCLRKLRRPDRRALLRIPNLNQPSDEAVRCLSKASRDCNEADRMDIFDRSPGCYQ